MTRAGAGDEVGAPGAAAGSLAAEFVVGAAPLGEDQRTHFLVREHILSQENTFCSRKHSL